MQIETFIKGKDIQSYYTKGRKLTSIEISQIKAICDCGYLTLKPTNEFEEYNGGVTVKRKGLKIFQNGKEIRLTKKIRTQYEIIHYWACNACSNEWK